MFSGRNTGEALMILISESQPRLNLMATLNHSSEAILSSEDISRLGVRSHTTTQSQLDFGLNAPPRGDLIHHYG